MSSVTAEYTVVYSVHRYTQKCILILVLKNDQNYFVGKYDFLQKDVATLKEYLDFDVKKKIACVIGQVCANCLMPWFFLFYLKNIITRSFLRKRYLLGVRYLKGGELRLGGNR